MNMALFSSYQLFDKLVYFCKRIGIYAKRQCRAIIRMKLFQALCSLNSLGSMRNQLLVKVVTLLIIRYASLLQ